MAKQIIKINEIKLKDVVISKGESTYCIFAKVYLPGVKPIHVTYDCVGCNLIIHEWYLLDEDIYSVIYDEFMEFLAMTSKMYH